MLIPVPWVVEHFPSLDLIEPRLSMGHEQCNGTNIIIFMYKVYLLMGNRLLSWTDPTSRFFTRFDTCCLSLLFRWLLSLKLSHIIQ